MCDANSFEQDCFQSIDSSKIESLPVKQRILRREDFFSLAANFPPPLIAKSDFISREMVEHLMRHKKDSALGVKYVVGDEITNMEGALHTFVTPVCRIMMTGDFRWVGHLQGEAFGNNQVRQVILSAAIHPDFENDTVIMPLVKVQEHAVIGEPTDLKEIPSALLKENHDFRARYEDKLLKHMIYHLSSSHQLQALNAISPQQIMEVDHAQKYLEELILNSTAHLNLQSKYVHIKKNVLSLEILFQIYVEQLRNEFKILNAHLSQGFVYTLSPPSIFTKAIGNATLLNRLQALAFQSLISENLFLNLQVLGFGDYADKGMIPLLRKALSHVKVVSTNELYDKKGVYNGPAEMALVLHNNSDAFGQNIQSEGLTSLDGVIGSFSNAASVLKRDRADLTDFIF